MQRILINSAICANHECSKCIGIDYVPEDCPYFILHVLDDVFLIERPRRSGKTTEIMKCAVDFAKQSQHVIVVFRTHRMAMRTKENHLDRASVPHSVQKLILVASMRSVSNGKALRGWPQSRYFIDEIRPFEFEKYLRKELTTVGHIFEKGYYTSF